MLKQNVIEYLDKLKMQMLQSDHQIDLVNIFDSFKLIPGEHINTLVPHNFEEQLKQMEPSLASLVQKFVILQCILNNWEAIFNGHYPESVTAQYKLAFDRLLSTCQTEVGWSKNPSSVYYKDLALAQQLLFPAGPLVIENSSGFGIRQGINSGVVQSVRFLWLNLIQRGSKGYYQIHIHTPQLSEFHPQGWTDSYLKIAQMLELNPQVKGVFAGSWFYDPQLKDISPRLMYLQDLPIENGASNFHIGEDKSGNAFYASPSRRKLFNEGLYTPQGYLLVWPRTAMIKWANHYNTAHNINTASVKSS